jgi:ADP-ribose pyrophosphatase YjhB (NUDIX family)
MRETGLYLSKAEGSFTYRVGALIIKDGKLLAAKSKNYPCYYTVGGVVEINETSEEAVIREVFEETGYKLEIDRLAIIQERFFDVDSQRYHELDLFYVMKNSDEMNIEDNSFTDQAPMETLHWIPICDLVNTNIVPSSLKTMSFDNINSIAHIISKE